TCYIELPAGHSIGDIDVSAVKLNDAVSAERQPTTIGDYDSDGISDLMVKFDMSGLQGTLQIGRAELSVSGRLGDGTRFHGADIVGVISKGNN
ncbi:MAG: hypothetical protein JW955_17835, partial [Sedimentisphaerales bacterium]|nr:hypothetical protein [Sedimentisphaerales bacterium]